MAVAVTYQSHAFTASPTTANPVTFAAMGMGAAAADRISVASIIADNRLTFTGVTINGVAATLAASINNSGDTWGTRLYYAANPTGTTGDVVLTFSTAPSASFACAVFSVTGATGAPYSTDSAMEVGLDLDLSALNIPPGGGAVLGGAYGEQTVAVDWSGTGVTEAYDIDATTVRSTGATSTTAGTNTVTMSSGVSATRMIVGASWAPAVPLTTPTYFGSASVPADGAAATNATATLTITPPASMLTGDLVVVICQSRVSATWSVGVTGGQTWTSETAFTTTNVFCRIFWCRFNGTWGANPRFDSTSSTATTAVMHVFRPYDTTRTWAIDVAQATNTFAAPSTPFTVTRAGVTTSLADTVTLAIWATNDDCSWTSLSGTGWATTGTAQYRNTSSTDQSLSFAHHLDPATATVVPSVSKNQTTVTGVAGITAIITWDAVLPISYTKSLADSLTLSETVTKTILLTKSVSDSIYLTEARGTALTASGGGGTQLTGLVSYWKLDEASGNRADAHGSNTLTDNNSTLGATGKINNGADFESTSTQYLSHTDNTDLSAGDTDWTFACWLKPESQPAFAVPVSKAWGGGQAEWVIYLDSGVFTFAVQSPASGQQTCVSSVSISNGTWYYVVVWHDSVNNQLGISVNGTTVTAAWVNGVVDSFGDFNLGASSAQGLYWDGLIDEAGWWRRVLTSTERAELYNSGAGLAYPFGGGGGGATAFTRLFGNQILFGEIVATTLTGGVVLTKSVADGLTLSDGRTGAAGFARPRTEPLILTEAVAKAAAFLRSRTEPLSMTDPAARAAAFVRAISNPLSVTDNIVLTSVLGKLLADGLTITEAITAALVLARLLGDGLTLTEVIGRAAVFVRARTEPLTLTENVVRLAGFIRSQSDALTLTEAFAKAMQFARAFSDPLVLTDSVALARLMQKAVADGLSLTEVVAKLMVLTRAAIDPLVLTEAIAKVAAYARPRTEPLTVSEVVTKALTMLRAYSDPLVLGENLVNAFTFRRSMGDALLLAEAISKRIPKGVSDALILGESAVVAALVLLRSITNALTVTEAITRTWAYARNPADALTLTETVGRALAKLLARIEPLTLTEVLNRAAAFRRSTSDAHTLEEALGRAFTFRRSLVDPIVLGGFAFTAEELLPYPPVSFQINGGPGISFEVPTDGLIITIEPLPNPN